MKALLIVLYLVFRMLFLPPFQSPQAEVWSVPVSADTMINPFLHDTKAVAEGKKIYENTCWTCHGMQGKGDGPAAVSLPVKPADHTSTLVQRQNDGAILFKISKGRGEMKPYERLLSKQQRWKLVCYIRELGKKAE